jgi:catechol 2,3-dioxygenase-like lactoylglutathione lyase family enzyme
MFVIQGIDHVALTVRDLDRSIAWYRDVLGLERKYQEAWGDRPVMMFAGDTGVALFAARGAVGAAPDQETAAIMRHLAFRVDRRSFLAAQEMLRARGIDFEFQDHAISQSIYFLDPDGYELELTTYEVCEKTA